MVKPSSFSTLCTSNCANELIGLLLSLSISKLELAHPSSIHLLTKLSIILLPEYIIFDLRKSKIC